MKPAALRALASGDIENFLVASTPGGIEAQEARGQQKLCQASQIPRRMLYGCTKEVLESMGIVFKEVADDLFYNVTLPPGWKLEPTDHSMWNKLLDDKGRRRASIFYKAAFYARSAHIWLDHRYTYDSYHNAGEGKYAVVITDCGKPIHEIGQYDKQDYPASNKLRGQALEWLKEHYPDYENKLAYWD